MSKKLLIALDYDDTYTADPILWQEFIRSALSRGHRIWIVTMRNQFEGASVRAELAQYVEKVICTERRGKKNFLTVNLGEQPDIWIDDSPQFIFNDHRSVAR